MLSDHCPVLSCLSVCPLLSVMLVYCGQMVARIKMKLSVQVGLVPGYIVLDGDPATPPQNRGQSSPIFSPCLCLLWPNGCMDQDATWYGGRPRPRPHCARWGPAPHPKNRGTAPHPVFVLCLLWPNGWMDHDAT